MKKILIVLMVLSSILSAELIRNTETKIVVDSVTKLEWYDDKRSGYRTWNEAVKYCEDLVFNDMDNWRLPNINELISIIDYTRSGIMFDKAFLYKEDYYYWSSTKSKDSESDFWALDNNTGNMIDLHMSKQFQVKCVRDPK